MKIHRLERTQILPLTLDEAWDFFSTPLNLNEITPEDMSFEILSDDLEGQRMYEGMIINYVVKAIANVPLRWTTEITHVKEKGILLMSSVLDLILSGTISIFSKSTQKVLK